ncbi:MAG: J domain-containing protein [Sulfurimonas sp.]|nr:J domain-containing protein [Sulfurimonas sp.]
MTKADIEIEFTGIDGINEAKKIYKVLAKRLHPDVGGSTEQFKILNEVYNYVLENGIMESDDAAFDLELEKVISNILHYENLIIEVVGSWIWLSGETRAIKEVLKDLKFKWASKKKQWYYGEMKGRNPKQKNMDDIKAKYGCTRVKTKQTKKVERRVA